MDSTQHVPGCYNKTTSQKSKYISIVLIIYVDLIWTYYAVVYFWEFISNVEDTQKQELLSIRLQKILSNNLGTCAQHGHTSKSFNGCSGNVCKKCISDDNGIDSDSSFSRFSNWSKYSTRRPIIQYVVWPFYIFCHSKKIEMVCILS